MPRRWLALIFVLGFFSRIPFLLRCEQDVDGARFVGGVLVYDVTRLHPHPPGYPVYMGPAIALQRLTRCEPALALSIVSAFGFALALAAVADVSYSWKPSRRGALLSAILTGLTTMISVLSVRPLSDSIALGLAWTTIAVALRHRDDRSTLAQTLVLAVLTASVRISVLPLVAPVCVLGIWRLRRDRRELGISAVLAAITGLACWMPVILSAGLLRWFHAVQAHATGHFDSFGGTIATQPNVTERLRSTLFYLWTHALSGPWFDRSVLLWVPTVAIFAAAMIPKMRPSPRPTELGSLWLVGGSGILYFAWVFLAQNVLWAPRHWAPIVPIFIIVIVGWLESVAHFGTRAVLVAMIAGPWSIESLRVLHTQSRQDPPALCLLKKLPLTGPKPGLVATGELGQWLRLHADFSQRILNFQSAEGARSMAQQNHWTIVGTSELSGVEALSTAHATPIRCLGDRYVWPAMYDLQWWTIR